MPRKLIQPHTSCRLFAPLVQLCARSVCCHACAPRQQLHAGGLLLERLVAQGICMLHLRPSRPPTVLACIACPRNRSYLHGCL